MTLTSLIGKQAKIKKQPDTASFEINGKPLGRPHVGSAAVVRECVSAAKVGALERFTTLRESCSTKVRNLKYVFLAWSGSE